jgi:hypothetical protein
MPQNVNEKELFKKKVWIHIWYLFHISAYPIRYILDKGTTAILKYLSFLADDWRVQTYSLP